MRSVSSWNWLATVNSSIGDPNQDLFVFGTVGSYRLYYTVFPTQQTLEPIQFLVN